MQTQGSVPLGPREEYTRRRDRARAESARLAKLDDLAGNGRLVVFGVGLILAVLAWHGDVGWLWSVAVVGLGFTPLVYGHGRVVAARRRAEGVVKHQDRGLTRLDDLWAGTGVAGTRFLDEGHPYATDLDLFGVGSLFERLCVARTAAGEATLAGWLLEPASFEEIPIRHEAVAELRPMLELS